MRRQQWLILATVLMLLVALWWLLTYTPQPTATVGYFGTNKFLCVRPGQVFRLTFSEPLPSGVKEAQQALDQQWMGAARYAHPEAAAETRYWDSLRSREWRLISEKEVILRIPENEFGIVVLEYPSPHKPATGQRFEIMLFVLGDKDLDRIIQRQEPLPADGRVPSKGNVTVYYKEASLWDRLRFWLYIEMVRKRGIRIVP